MTISTLIRLIALCMVAVWLSGCATAKSRVKPAWTMPNAPYAHKGECPKVTNKELMQCRKSKNPKMKEMCHRAIRCWQLEDWLLKLRGNWPL